MKTLFTPIVLLLTSLAAFGQGKINFGNDSLHLVYYPTDTSFLRASDVALAGQGVSSTAMPAGVTLVDFQQLEISTHPQSE